VLDFDNGKIAYFPQGQVRPATGRALKDLEGNPKLLKLQAIVQNPNTPLPNQFDFPTSSRVGDKVQYVDSNGARDDYHIQRITATGKLRLEKADGTALIDTSWSDSNLIPGWNSSSFRPLADDETTASGFLTSGGFHSGSYVWVEQRGGDFQLAVIAPEGIRGNVIRVVDAISAEVYRAEIKQLRHVNAGSFTNHGIWGQFARAVMEGSRSSMQQYAPGNTHPMDCNAGAGEFSRFGDSLHTDYQRPTEGVVKPYHDDDERPTPQWAQAQDRLEMFDESRGFDPSSDYMSPYRGSTIRKKSVPDNVVTYIVVAGVLAFVAYTITR